MTNVVKSIKGFKSDMTCRDFKFEVGKTYTHEGNVGACEGGFHACPIEHHPLSVFEYYPPAGSIYREVEQSGDMDASDTKLASAVITIGVEISLGEITKRAVDFVMANLAPQKSKRKTNSGDYGAATNSGDSGAAFSHAPYSRVMCEGDGQALYCTEFADDGSITSVACGITGRDGIKANTWYKAKNGELVEA